MINVKELRIYNWVNVSNIPYTVNGAFIAEIEKANCTWRKTVSPIPLTKYILEKCGFKNSTVEGFTYLSIGNDSYLASGGDSVWVEKYIDDDRGFESVGLGGAETVHGLQNLYYCLVGKELEITL